MPYLETIRSEARAQGRYKKQTGGRGQFGDCHIVIEPIERQRGYEFVDKIVGGVIPHSFRPAVDKGIQEAMQHGELAGAPVQGVRVTLVDGSYHNVDSSEMAFKIAGSMAFKKAYEKAQPALLEPIMEVEVTVPDESVGAVNGDLNSRRGRLHGMEPNGGMTTIKAEVPMAEMLTYSQSLTSLTGGRGDYHMQFAPLRGGAGAHRAEADRGCKKEKEAGLGRAELRRDPWSDARAATGAASTVCAICERTLLMGERAVAVLAERRRRVRRRLPALRGDRASSTAGSSEGRRRRRRAGRSAAGGGYSSPRSLGTRRAGAEEPVAPDPILRRLSEPSSRSSRRPTSSTRRIPPHGRRDRKDPRLAEGLGGAALGRQCRGRRDRRVGHLVVPVPRLARLGPPVRLEGAGTIPTSSRARSPTGTPILRTTAGSFPDIAASSAVRGPTLFL